MFQLTILVNGAVVLLSFRLFAFATLNPGKGS